MNANTALEAAGTMAEETLDGGRAAPAALVKSAGLSGVGGFLLIMSMLFACRGTFDGIFAGPTASPEINLFVIVF